MLISTTLSYAYKYDARGALTKQSDNKGRAVTLERDASGALVGAASADGRWVRATRDEAGRIIALNNSSGKSRHYEYDARGSLTGYTDARGKRRTFSYDPRGRLRAHSDAEGVSALSDGAGRLITVRRETALRAGAARLLPASYEPPSSSSLAAQDGFGCGFGDDGWFDGDNFFGNYGMLCDIFGGFGDPWGFYYGETCQQCMDRQAKICEANLKACVAVAVGVPLTAAAACVVVADPSAMLTCLGIVSIAAGILVAGCVASRYSCEPGILDRCTMCN